LAAGYALEHRLFQGDPSLSLAGMDEAGRGPIAGPLAVGVFTYTPTMESLALDDSKKLTPGQRLKAHKLLVGLNSLWAVGFALASEIDTLGISRAFRLAARRALDELPYSPSILLVDGTLDPRAEAPCILLPKGDMLSGTIAAASILAKTMRDRLMEKLDARYPAYGFAVHKGYPTCYHVERVRMFGPCPEHRVSFAPLKHHEWQAC